MGVSAVRLVSHEHFHNHFTCCCGAVIGGVYHHAFGWLADTGCGKDAFTFNFNHTSAAIAVSPVIGVIFVAKVRDCCAFTLGNLPDAFIGIC